MTMTKTVSSQPQKRTRYTVRTLVVRHPAESSLVPSIRRDLHASAISLQNFLLDPVETILERKVDLVVAAYHPDLIECYEAIREQIADVHRPLLAFFITPTPEHYLSADLLLPLDPAAAEMMIRQAVEQRRARYHAEHALAQTRRELSEQRAQAVEYSMLKAAFAATVTHEFRSPFTKVKTAVVLLANDYADDSRVQLAMTAIDQLQNNILSVTQLSQGLEVRIEPCLVSYTIDYAMNELRRSEQYQPQVDRIRVTIEPRLPLIEADVKAIGIVLHRLLENALKFSKREVELTITRSEEHVVFTVQDYGEGIPRHKINHIWDDYYQLDGSNSKRHYGLGVGLAIVRFILDRHDTTIDVASEPKRGSAFTFALPICPPR